MADEVPDDGGDGGWSISEFGEWIGRLRNPQGAGNADEGLSGLGLEGMRAGRQE